MTSLWRQNRKRSPEISLWLVDYILQFVAPLLISLRNIIPDLFSIVLANAFIIGGTVVLYVGLERYVGEKTRQLHNYVMVAVFTFIHAFFTYVYPSLAIRNVNLSLALLYICAQGSWLTLRRVHQDLRSATRATGIVFIMLCIVSVAHFIDNLVHTPGNQLFMSGPLNAIVILVQEALFIALTFALFLLVSRRLLTALEGELKDRKQAEEALKKSNTQVRLLLNSTAEAIYGINLEGNCTFINFSCLRMLGYTGIEQLLGRNMHQLIHHSYPDGSPMPVDVCRIFQAFREGKGVHVDDEVLWRADGSCFPVEYWSYPQILDGEVSGAVVTFINITERRQAEDELRESRQQFRGLVETLYDWVWEVDSQGHYTYISPQIKNILGYEPQEILGKTPYDLMSPEEAKRVSEIFGVLIKERKPIAALENINIHKDGRLVVLETNGLPFYDAGGNFKGYRGTDRDITRRKLVEEEIKQSEEKLKEAQRIAQLGNWELDLTKNTLLWSDGIYELFEINPMKFGASYEAFLNAIHPDDRVMVDHAYTESLKSRTTYEISHRLLMKDGRVKWVNEICRTEYDKRGNPLKSFGIVQDITKRKQAEEALKETSEYLNNLIEYANAPIIVWDTEFRITRFNRAFEQITGMSAKDVIGKHIELLFPEETKKQSLEHIRKTVSGEKWETVEIPIRHVDGTIRTLLWNSANIYSTDGKTLVSTIAQGQDITERKRTEEKIEHMATHDGLTDLPSLRLAKDRLAMAMGLARRKKTAVAVMFVDLDGFKTVNDTYGHDVGDEVLREVAKRFCSCVRETDTVARVGGDEFLLIATELHSPDNAARIAEKVLHLMSQPFSLNEKQAAISASIGIALYQDSDEDIDGLIKMADEAMYRIKNSGKNGYIFANTAK